MVHVTSDLQLGHLSADVHFLTDTQLDRGIPTRLSGPMLVTLTDFMRWRMRHDGAVSGSPDLIVVYFTAKGSLRLLSEWALSPTVTARLREAISHRPATHSLLRLLLADLVSRTLGVRNVYMYDSDTPTSELRSALSHLSPTTGAPFISDSIQLMPPIIRAVSPTAGRTVEPMAAWPPDSLAPSGLTVWDTNIAARDCQAGPTTYLLTPPVEVELAKHVLWPPPSPDGDLWRRRLREVKESVARRNGFRQVPELRRPVLDYLVSAPWTYHLGPREYMDQLVLAACLTGSDVKPLHGLCTYDQTLRGHAAEYGISIH